MLVKEDTYLDRYVLASHGELASGMKDSVQLILGRDKEIFTICAYSDGSTGINDKIETVFSRFNREDHVFVFTDILGGSVNNDFIRILNKKKFYLITGMSLPLVIEIMTNDNIADPKERIKTSIDECKKYICFCNELLENYKSEITDF